jgi:predicted RNase H-like nuclease (RuvC/YqgF family)
MSKDETIKKLEEENTKLKKEIDRIKYLIYKCSESLMSNS